ncbi:MAG: nitrilase family protein, partial [Chryseobacterium sp.]
MQDLSITLIQTKLHWHDAEANRAMFQEKIESITKPTDLIILPEMFSTGFSM